MVMPPPDDYNRRCLTSKSGYWVWKSAFCPRIHSMKISLYLQCIKTSHGDPISLACRKRRLCTMILRKDRKSKIPCHNRSLWHVHEIEPCLLKGPRSKFCRSVPSPCDVRFLGFNSCLDFL